MINCVKSWFESPLYIRRNFFSMAPPYAEFTTLIKYFEGHYGDRSGES